MVEPVLKCKSSRVWPSMIGVRMYSSAISANSWIQGQCLSRRSNANFILALPKARILRMVVSNRASQEIRAYILTNVFAVEEDQDTIAKDLGHVTDGDDRIINPRESCVVHIQLCQEE